MKSRWLVVTTDLWENPGRNAALTAARGTTGLQERALQEARHPVREALRR